MIQNTNTTTEKQKDISPAHPVSQATAALYASLGPLREHLEVNRLADDLADALIADRIGDLADSAVLLAMQARVLDAAFNRFTALAMLPDHANIELLRTALQVQRQCAGTIDKLKRHQKKLQKTDDRTEGP
jgi:histidinol-phosphate/aromatic aminotransferase/cobyric acid decarboxylase-like protein